MLPLDENENYNCEYCRDEKKKNVRRNVKFPIVNAVIPDGRIDSI